MNSFLMNTIMMFSARTRNHHYIISVSCELKAVKTRISLLSLSNLHVYRFSGSLVTAMSFRCGLALFVADSEVHVEDEAAKFYPDLGSKTLAMFETDFLELY